MRASVAAQSRWGSVSKIFGAGPRMADERELVLLLSIELELIIRADPCQARPVATDLGRAL
jgi:hypothetical protein